MGEVALTESGVDLPAKPEWTDIVSSFLSSTCALPGKQFCFLKKLCSPETKGKFFFLMQLSHGVFSHNGLWIKKNKKVYMGEKSSADRGRRVSVLIKD